MPCLICTAIFCLSALPAAAQETAVPDSLRPDSTEAPADSLDPEQQQESSRSSQSVQSGERQEGQVDFQSSDSLTFDFEGRRIARLYGSAEVRHEAGELSSGVIEMDLDETTAYAETSTPEDTTSQPVLTRDGDQIRSERISFNYVTEKGRFEVARVNIQDGKVTGNKIKNTSPHVVFLEDAIYSTCELDHPHYYIKAKRMKVVDDDELFFTQARLYILDIPYPLVFPFGYLPNRSIDQQQSGLLEPTYAYQEQSSRGIGLQNLGWFQYFNDYLVGQASVDIFTSGTFYLDAGTDYRVSDVFNGGLDIGYSRENSGLEPTDEGFTTNIQKKVGFTHSHTLSPYAKLSANLNFRTADFNRRNSYDPDERAETSTSSRASYNYRHPEGLYSFDISARQNQNFQTNVTRFTGPQMSFSTKTFSPFSRDGAAATEEAAWYENISISYQNDFQSDFEYDPIDADSAETGWLEALMDAEAYREATGDDDHYRYGFEQDASISLSQILPNQYINTSSSINYTEYWFPTTTRRVFNPDENRVETEQVRGFTTARDFSTSLSMSTTFYGLWNQRIGNIEGFRHTVRPNLSFSYSPDFGSDFWGYYREVQSDTTGNTQRYSIFEDEVFSGPGQGESRSINFSLNNIFEAKQVRRDSTGEKSENNLKLVDRLNMSGSYNFAADSLNLSRISLNFSSGVIPGINITASGQLDPYINRNGRRVNRFQWNDPDSKMLLQPITWNASASFSLDGGGGRGVRVNEDQVHYPARYDPLDQSMFNGFDQRFNQQPVQPLDSPWSASFDISYRWRNNGDPSATINARNINFRLTPKWQFRTQMGYDFVDKEFTPSQFSLSRNLHCWRLEFTMNPFGEDQYYFFRLTVDSGQLGGIMQKLPLLNNLERQSSGSGRGFSGQGQGGF